MTYLLAKQENVWSARQQCHLAYMAEYTVDIQHMPGVENVVADASSLPLVVAAVVHIPPPLQSFSTGLSWLQHRPCARIWLPYEPRGHIPR